MDSVEDSRWAAAATSGYSDVVEGGSSFIGTSEGAPLLPREEATMAVKDRYSFAYLIFYLLGLGSLLPWNFFITARDYWMYKLGDFNTTDLVPVVPATVTTGFSNTTVLPVDNSSSTAPNYGPEVTSMQKIFMNSLAVCAMLPNVIFQFLNTLLQKRIPQNVRILSTLGLMIVLFIFTEVLVKTDTSTWQDTFVTITLATVVIINSCSAIFQSSVFGLAARFPQKYSGAVMAGQGMGGVFAAIAMIISLAFSSNPTDSAFIFFLTAIGVLAITMVFYVLLTKLEFYKFFTPTAENQKRLQAKDFKLESPSFDDQEQEVFFPPVKINAGDESEIGNGEGQRYSKASSNSTNEKSDSSNMIAPMLHIASKIWLHMFCVAYTFFITLACFPAVTAGIRPMASGTAWADIYFSPVCCFLLFNLADWVGRTSASYIHIPSSNSKVSLFILVLGRTIFPFLFALCNYQPRAHLPVVFKQDFFFIIFMILFALSNGHLSTLSMQYGPKQVDPEDSATAGSMLAFMISVGLFAGAGISFLVTSLI